MGASRHTNLVRNSQAAIDLSSGCPQTNPPVSQTGSVLQQFADDTNAGVVFDGGLQVLRLKKAGGYFTAATLPVPDTFVAATAADFDEDGWTDIIGGREDNRYTAFYKNRTYENPEPANWNDPTQIRDPKFVATNVIIPYNSTFGRVTMASGDFDNDGHADFVYMRNEGSDTSYPEFYRMYLGNGDGTFQAPYNFQVGSYTQFGYMTWLTSRLAVGDYDNDGWLDIVHGTQANSTASSGRVQIWVNNCPDTFTPGVPCSVNPQFVLAHEVTGVNNGTKGPTAVAYHDLTGDGIEDLVVGGPSFCGTNRMRLYPGLAGGGFGAYQAFGGPNSGNATTIMVHDFSLDGRPDVVYGTDEWHCGSHRGGQTYYFANNGTSTPLSSGVTQQLTYHQSHSAGNLYDLDLGALLDYDRDPDGTMDFLIADGNHAGTFFMFANRTRDFFVECGDVASGVLDLGPLADDEMVVNAARLSPTMSIPAGGTVTFYMTNTTPPQWVPANPCADDPNDYCATFPGGGGRDVQWKATMCSPAPNHTETPTISEMEVAFDYTVAKEHFRAGVVVHDGVAYAGGFRQPGNRGKFYAVNAGLSEIYWEASSKLDAMLDSERSVFTATVTGDQLVPFTVAQANSATDTSLLDTLGATSAAEAVSIVQWQRSARFGVAGGGVPLSRLGAVESSTAAVLSAPSRPLWYHFADATERADLDAFLASHADRKVLVLFGSRDGALHALYSEATNITDPTNGREAWAFIPAKVAFGFQSDITNGRTDNYPDGSPTLADVRFSDGSFHTIAVVAGGTGARSVFALDVTETVDELSGTVYGPTPLWHLAPGGADAGEAVAKPIVVRTSIAGSERFVAVVATGPAGDDPTPPYGKGTTVAGVDAQTGALLWQLQTRCSVTSDLTAFETNDDTEPGAPQLDGFIDRVVVADQCGYLYKLDPAVDAGGDFITGMGSVAVLDEASLPATDSAGNEIVALFYVGPGGTTGALGEGRPISGAIAVRADATKRTVLFFGTGGMETFDPTYQNALYAVYADTGEIRTSLLGDCPATAGGRCEKFYGGAVATVDQVITTRSVDPPIGSGSCDTGSATITGINVNENADGEFIEEFEQTVSSGVVAGVYGSGGAVYTTTLSGHLVRIGAPRSPDAGGDTSGGFVNETGPGDGEGALSDDGTGPMALRGWRQQL